MPAYTPPSRRGDHHTAPSRWPLIGLLCLLAGLMAAMLLYRYHYNRTGQRAVDVLHQHIRDNVPRHHGFPQYGDRFEFKFREVLPGPTTGYDPVGNNDCVVWYETWLFGNRVERLCSERVPGEGPSPPWMDPHRPERDEPEVIHDLPAEAARPGR